MRASLTGPPVVTWADGLGRWHAAVPLALTAVPASTDAADVRRMFTRAARLARVAIRRELDMREVSPSYRLRVRREHLTAHGTVHYGEV